MKYTIVIDKAIPGTALGGTEPARLKKEIATYAEGLGGLKTGGKYGPFDFKDDLNKKRKYHFKVLKIDKGGKVDTIHIEITDFITI
jgi:hypothetical protein